MGEVYFTPQHKIIAQIGKREPYMKQEGSEYIYESDKGFNATTSRNVRTNNDEYVLPPQDREHTPEIRPRKEKKGNVQDIYDEGHYSLARNSGFDEDFTKSGLENSKVFENQAGHGILKKSHMITICVILIMFAIGGILAYLLIDRIGDTTIRVLSTPAASGPLIAYEWIMMKDKTIGNEFVLSKKPLHGCEELSVFCYWKDLKTAKSKCNEWPDCSMLKEAKDSIGLKLYLAVEMNANETDIQDSVGNNIWIRVKAASTVSEFSTNDVETTMLTTPTPTGIRTIQTIDYPWRIIKEKGRRENMFDDANGCKKDFGMAFDIENKSPSDVEINGLWLLMGQNGGGKIRVFISKGGYIAAGNKKSSWTLAKTYSYIGFSYQGPLELSSLGSDLPSSLSIAPGEKFGIYVHCDYKSWDPLDCGVIYRWKGNTNFKPPILEDENLLVAHTGVRVSSSKVPFEQFASNLEPSTTMPMMVDYQKSSSSVLQYITNQGCSTEEPGFSILMGRVRSFGFMVKAKERNIILQGIRGLNVDDWRNVEGLQVWIYSKMSNEDQKFGNAPLGMKNKQKWVKIKAGNVKLVENGSWLDFAEPIIIEKSTTTAVMILSTNKYMTYSYYDGGKFAAQDENLWIPKGGWSEENLSNIFSDDNPKIHFFEVWCFHGSLRYRIER